MLKGMLSYLKHDLQKMLQKKLNICFLNIYSLIILFTVHSACITFCVLYVYFNSY